MRARRPALSAFVRHSAIVITAMLVTGFALASTQVDIAAPPGSFAFGSRVVALPNGNFVVADPGFSAPGPVEYVGAVHLYRRDGTLISTLTGSSPGDQVGSYVTVLSNGNFVVSTSWWDNGAIVDAEAVTWIDADVGLSGTVSPANSLVGTSTFGLGEVVPLTNGSYVVASTQWDSPSGVDVGAFTWGSGTAGVAGVVSAANSLVGSAEGDGVGSRVIPLPNGNYVVRSRLGGFGAVTWGDGTGGTIGVVDAANSLVGSYVGELGGSVLVLSDGDYAVVNSEWGPASPTAVGAVTWCNGDSPTVGHIGPANSLVGRAAEDRVGAVFELGNGNLIVQSRDWHDDQGKSVGAVTWVPGATKRVGPVTSANSLVGSREFDGVGSGDPILLTNGNYVVRSPQWDNGAIVNAGAATWGDGDTGIVGVVSAANSLVGSSAEDQVGNPFIGALLFQRYALGNGNYIVVSAHWNKGTIVDAGAVTWGDGDVGTVGTVTAGNSLTGSTAGEFVGRNTAVSNVGHYVVGIPGWDDGPRANVGAITRLDGTAPTSAVVSAANSLVGSNANDFVGQSVSALDSGNYLAISPQWDNGGIVNAGAVTFLAGATATSGTISAANSLVGGTTGDFATPPAGLLQLKLFAGGAYLVATDSWDDGPSANVGALAWGNGTTGVIGLVTPSNALIGEVPSDGIGGQPIDVQADGAYITTHPGWDSATVQDAGAMIYGAPDGTTTGYISPGNSVLGTVPNDIAQADYDYDPQRRQLIVGRRVPGVVTLFRPGIATTSGAIQHTPDPSESDRAVLVTVPVAAATRPIDGRVRVYADTGESCEDNTPAAAGATTSRFECSLVLPTPGTVMLRAEYLGSATHGYSTAAAVAHEVIESSLIFGDGFEQPTR